MSENGRMDVLREARRLKTLFSFTLPQILTSGSSRVVKQLQRSGPMALVDETIDNYVGRCKHSPMRRFLAGEFTDGNPPVFVPKTSAGGVENILKALDVIATMAHEADNVCEHNWRIFGTKYKCEKCLAVTEDKVSVDGLYSHGHGAPPPEKKKTVAAKKAAKKKKVAEAVAVVNTETTDDNHVERADSTA